MKTGLCRGSAEASSSCSGSAASRGSGRLQAGAHQRCSYLGRHNTQPHWNVAPERQAAQFANGSLVCGGGVQQRSLCCCSATLRTDPPALRTGGKVDLVLSSGFLAFAHHSGFLQAIEDAGLRVAGVMGTSAGALAGSLYCAGYTPRQVAKELSRDEPARLLRPSLEPWRGGVLSLDGVVERLRELLPPRFEDLEKEFAVGVVTQDGDYMLIDRGPLPEAVAASAAIPFIFQPVDVPGHSGSPLKDGGLVDRVGIKAWRERRRRQIATTGAIALGPGRRSAASAPPPAVVHVIHRSSPFSGADDVGHSGEGGVVVVKSPRSHASFFSLGDFDSVMASAQRRARPVVEQAKRDSPSPEHARRLVKPA